MQGDRVCYNGTLTDPEALTPDPERWLGAHFVFRQIHTHAHKPFHPRAHIELADRSFTALYGILSGLDEGMLREEIAAVLEANRYPKGSVLVTLYLFPTKDGTGAERLVCPTRTLVYPGYTLWHSRPRAIVVPYDYPFPEHHTSLSLSAHRFAEDYARRTDADTVLVENYAGVITSAAGYPLFAVREGSVLTTPLDAGAADSVLRRLGLLLCEKAGAPVEETPLEASALESCDELFLLDPQGVVSLKSWDGRLGFNTVAFRLGSVLTKGGISDFGIK